MTPLPPVRPEGLTTTGVEPNEVIAVVDLAAALWTTRSERRGLGGDFGQHRARERLVPLDLSAGSGRADRARALSEQRVDDAGGQRFVGADHRDVDVPRARERGDRLRVAHVTDVVPAAGGRGVAHDRRVLVTDERVQLAVLGHGSGKRALASAVTDDQGSHAASVNGCPAFRLQRWL